MIDWTPPSLSKLDRFPHVIVDGANALDKYLSWFDSNKGIPRTVPPIYKDFVLCFTRTFSADGTEHRYEDIVHYDDSLTILYVCHVLNGKKILTVKSDYNNYDGASFFCEASYPKSTGFTDAWLKNETTAVISAVLAIQMWMLYFQPDVVPVEFSSPKTSRKASSKGLPAHAPRVISDSRRKIIRLGDWEPSRAPARYQKIQWSVRGHYRRMKSGKLVYVHPHIAKRGWSRTTPTTILKSKKEKTK